MDGDDEKKPENQGYKFDPNEHLMQLKSKEGAKDYLPVQWRLVWFRDDHTEGIIETEMLLLDLEKELEKEGFAWNNDTRRSEKVIKKAKGIAVFRAVAKNSTGGVGTGHGSESAADFDDFIEKAETKAIGRALAALGYGTQFAPELDEQHRIVDAPVDRGNNIGTATPPAPVPGNEQKEREERKPIATVKTASKPPVAQKTPTTPAPVVVEEVKGEGKAAGVEESSTGESQVQVIDADDMIPEKARIIIARLEKELGMFELKRFQLLLGLKAEENIYDAIHWQGLNGEELMGRAIETLTKWLKPHPKRTEWLSQTILPEQMAKIKNTLVPDDGPARHRKAFERNTGSIQSFFVSALVGKTEGLDEAQLNAAYTRANGEAVNILAEVIAQDKDMHGKQIGKFTAGEADRFISYFDPVNGSFENRVFTPNIPEEFRYKESTTKTATVAA